MTKTINRRTFTVKEPEENDKYFNHVNWKGLCTDKNYFNIDQETFEDCKNVYMDSELILKSRPSIQTKISNVIPENVKIENVWKFAETFFYEISNGQLFIINDDKHIQTYIDKGSIPFNYGNGIYWYYNNLLQKYDLKTLKTYYASDDIYVPTTKVITNGVFSDSEKRNILTNKEKYTYIFDGSDNYDLSTIRGSNVKITVGETSYNTSVNEYTELLTFEERSSILKTNFYHRYSNDSDEFKNMDILDRNECKILMDISDNNVILKSELIRNVSDDGTVSDVWKIGFSVDGKVYNDIPSPEFEIFGTPLISRDGTLAVVFGTDGPYGYSLFEDYVDGRLFSVWTNLDYYNINSEEGLTNRKNYKLSNHTVVDGQQVSYNKNDTVGGIFYNHTTYRYMFAYESDIRNDELIFKKLVELVCLNGNFYIKYNTNKNIQIGGTDVQIAICNSIPSVNIKLSTNISYTSELSESSSFLLFLYRCVHLNMYETVDQLCAFTSPSSGFIVGAYSNTYPIQSAASFVAGDNLMFSYDEYDYLYSRQISQGSQGNDEIILSDVEDLFFVNGTDVIYRNHDYDAVWYYASYTDGYSRREMLNSPDANGGSHSEVFYVVNNASNTYILYSPYSDGSIYTDLKLYSNVLKNRIIVTKELEGNVGENVLTFDKFVSSNNIFFSKDNKLYISENRYVDNKPKLYLPDDLVEEFDDVITNLYPLSTTQLGIFFNDEIRYAELTDKGYAFYKSKISLGCKKDADVVSSYDGKYVIFSTKRGLVYMSYQDFVQSTDQTLTFLSDQIFDKYSNFNKKPIKLYLYKYWLFCWHVDEKEFLVFDMRNNSWWPWYYKYPIKTMTSVDDELELVLSTDVYPNSNLRKLNKLKNNYKDDEDSIDWYFTSQKLHLGTLNYYKNVHSIIINNVQTELSDEPISFNLQIKNYRTDVSNRYFEPKTLEYNVNLLRSYVKRCNSRKLNEFQYTISSDDENAIQYPLSINSIIIKYNISGKVR